MWIKPQQVPEDDPNNPQWDAWEEKWLGGKWYFLMQKARDYKQAEFYRIVFRPDRNSPELFMIATAKNYLACLDCWLWLDKAENVEVSLAQPSSAASNESGDGTDAADAADDRASWISFFESLHEQRRKNDTVQLMRQVVEDPDGLALFLQYHEEQQLDTVPLRCLVDIINFRVNYDAKRAELACAVYRQYLSTDPPALSPLHGVGSLKTDFNSETLSDPSIELFTELQTLLEKKLMMPFFGFQASPLYEQYLQEHEDYDDDEEGNFLHESESTHSVDDAREESVLRTFQKIFATIPVDQLITYRSCTLVRQGQPRDGALYIGARHLCFYSPASDDVLAHPPSPHRAILRSPRAQRNNAAGSPRAQRSSPRLPQSPGSSQTLLRSTSSARSLQPSGSFSSEPPSSSEYPPLQSSASSDSVQSQLSQSSQPPGSQPPQSTPPLQSSQTLPSVSTPPATRSSPRVPQAQRLQKLQPPQPALVLAIPLVTICDLALSEKQPEHVIGSASGRRFAVKHIAPTGGAVTNTMVTFDPKACRIFSVETQEETASLDLMRIKKWIVEVPSKFSVVYVNPGTRREETHSFLCPHQATEMESAINSAINAAIALKFETGGVAVPNAIWICTVDPRNESFKTAHIFANFSNRKETFRLVSTLWDMVLDDMQVSLEQRRAADSAEHTLKSVTEPHHFSTTYAKRHLNEWLRVHHTFKSGLEAKRKNEKFQQAFRVPLEETIAFDYKVRLRDAGETYRAGRLLVSQDFLCFRSHEKNASRLELVLPLLKVKDVVYRAVDNDEWQLIVMTAEDQLKFRFDCKVEDLYSTLYSAAQRSGRVSKARRLSATSKFLTPSFRNFEEAFVSKTSKPAVHEDSPNTLRLKHHHWRTPSGSGGRNLGARPDREVDSIPWARRENTNAVFLKNAQARELALGGMPDALRGTMWYTWSGAAFKALLWPGRYENLMHYYGGIASPIVDQIRKDLSRTSSHPFYQTEMGRESLERVLTAYSWRNPRIGYTQSMNMVCALLLLYLDEERAFWTLCSICEDLLPDYYSPSMSGASADQNLFEVLLLKHLPAVVKHIDHLGMMQLVMSFSFQWFMSFFQYQLPMEVSYRVADLFFYEGREVFFRVGLALFRLLSPQILADKDGSEIPDTFRKLQPGAFSVDELMRIAQEEFGHVNRKTVAELYDTFKFRHLQYQRKAEIDIGTSTEADWESCLPKLESPKVPVELLITPPSRENSIIRPIELGSSGNHLTPPLSAASSFDEAMPGAGYIPSVDSLEAVVAEAEAFASDLPADAEPAASTTRRIRFSLDTREQPSPPSAGDLGAAAEYALESAEDSFSDLSGPSGPPAQRDLSAELAAVDGSPQAAKTASPVAAPASAAERERSGSGAAESRRSSSPPRPQTPPVGAPGQAPSSQTSPVPSPAMSPRVSAAGVQTDPPATASPRTTPFSILNALGRKFDKALSFVSSNVSSSSTTKTNSNSTNNNNSGS